MLLQYYTLRRKLTTTTPVYSHASLNLARKRIILRKSDNGTRLKTRALDSKNGKILLLFITIYYYTRLCRVVALRQSAACHVITLLFLFLFPVFFILFIQICRPIRTMTGRYHILCNVETKMCH